MGKLLHQFQMDSSACKYVFKSGDVAIFEGSYYRTSDQKKIDELNAEIEAGIGAIWIPKEGATVDSDELDPVAVMKRKIIAEYESEKARSLNNGVSFSDTSGHKAAGTNTFGVNAATSNSPVGAAQAVSIGSIKIGKSAATVAATA